MWRWIDDRKNWAEMLVDGESYTCPKDREPLFSWLEEGNTPKEWTEL